MTVEKKNKRKREGHTHTIMLYGGGGGGGYILSFPLLWGLPREQSLERSSEETPTAHLTNEKSSYLYLAA